MRRVWLKIWQPISGWMRALITRLRGSKMSARGLALSVAVGLVIGLIPLYGMHGVLVLAVCLPLRLDSAVAFASTMVSNPVTLPLLVAAELEVGAALIGQQALDADRLLAGEGWSEAALQLAAGTCVVASSVGLLGALLVWWLVRSYRRARAA